MKAEDRLRKACRHFGRQVTAELHRYDLYVVLLLGIYTGGAIGFISTFITGENPKHAGISILVASAFLLFKSVKHLRKRDGDK